MTQPAQRQPILRFGVFELDLEACELSRNGNVVSLQDRLFRVLCVLLEQRPRAVSKEDLQERVWGSDVHIDINAGVGQAIFQLREALGDAAQSPSYIKTVKGRGYRFIAAVEEVTPESAEPQKSSPAPPRPPDPTWNWKPAVALATVALAGLAVWAVIGRAPPPTPQVRRWSYSVEKLTVDARTQPIVAISPDGEKLVFGADHALWLQKLDELWNPRKLPGTESDGIVRPAWSPDSAKLAFAIGQDVFRLDLSQGAPKRLANAGGLGLLQTLWSSDGRSVFVRASTDINVTPPKRDWKLSPDGGDSEPTDALALAPAHLSLLAGDGAGVGEAGDKYFNEIVFWDGPHREPHSLGVGRAPSLTMSGHLVYQRHRDGDGVWAMPFSQDRGQATGQPFVVAQGGKSPTVSVDGTLVYADIPEEHDQLLLLDREGNPIRNIGARQRYIAYPSFSPDGKRVAVWGFEYATPTDWMVDIWIHEVDRPAKTRITTHPKVDLYPQWTPDGRAVSFSSDRTHERDLYLKSVESSRPAELLLADDRGKWISDWSSDGRRALMWSADAEIWMLDAQAQQTTPLLMTPFKERGAVFSPDERYIAFASDRSGRVDVWVCPIVSCADNLRQVSTNGGYQVRWAKEQGALYFVEDNRRMMQATITTEPELVISEPVAVFESPYLWLPGSSRVSFYDVTEDGEQFVVVEPARARTTKESPGVIHVWQNWAAAFEEKE